MDVLVNRLHQEDPSFSVLTLLGCSHPSQVLLPVLVIVNEAVYDDEVETMHLASSL